jgi:flagellar protein FliS
MMNAAQLYGKTAVTTASPEDLTLMLYNGAIKFCNFALAAMEKKDIPTAGTNIMKAEKIISELQNTLNDAYPVSKDFDVIYNAIMRNLIDANVSKKPEPLNAALKDIRDIRDIWVQLMKAKKG